MLKQPLDLSQARILISNDDGIHATGIRILEEIFKPIAKEVWVVAPEAEQSGAGHSLSLRDPLRYRQVKENWYAVSGTPTDSVLMALKHILKDNPPDLVLSGINRGANLGEDVTYSGTVSAAMEGTLLGIPSIALSLLIGPGRTPWATAAHWTPIVVEQLVSVPWPDNVLINVNFPNVKPEDVTGVTVARQGRRRIGGEMVEQTDPRGMAIYWIGLQRDHDNQVPGADIDVVRAGGISVTPLTMEMTHEAMFNTLEKIFP